MKDEKKTKAELLAELRAMRREMRGNAVHSAEADDAEKALWESQMGLVALLNNLPGMAYRAALNPETGDRHVEFVSAGCMKLTGRPAAAYINDPSLYRNEVVHPEDREYVKRAIAKAEKERIPYQLVYRIIKADGEVRWLSEHGMGLYDAGAKLIAREGFINDVSDSIGMSTVISQRLELMTAVSTNLLHEFDDHLGEIADCGQQALESLDDPRRTRHFLTRMLHIVGHTREITETLLGFLREDDQQTHSVDLGEICREAENMLRTLFPEQVTVECRVPDGDTHIEAKFNELRFVIVTLALNAGRSLGTNGGTVRVDLKVADATDDEIQAFAAHLPSPLLL